MLAAHGGCRPALCSDAAGPPESPQGKARTPRPCLLYDDVENRAHYFTAFPPQTPTREIFPSSLRTGDGCTSPDLLSVIARPT